MSEAIKLKVPSKPTAEYVSVGNNHATLKPGSVITVDNRRFADFLVNEYALAEVDGESEPSAVSGEQEETAEAVTLNKTGGKK